MTNKELIDKIIKDNDKHAFSLFFDRIYTPLVKFSYYYVKNYQMAEDVVSDVFVNFLKKTKESESINYAEAFFYTAVKNQSLKYLRKNKYNIALYRGEGQVEHEIISNSRPDQELMDKELYEIISKELNSLPTQSIVIFEMVKYDQLKYKEVANKLNISQKTVEKHMSTALKKIRLVVFNYLESNDINIEKIKKSSLLFFFI